MTVLAVTNAFWWLLIVGQILLCPMELLLLLVMAFAKTPVPRYWRQQRMFRPILVIGMIELAASVCLLIQWSWWSISVAFVLTFFPILQILGYCALFKRMNGQG